MGYGQFTNDWRGRTNPLRNKPRTSRKQVFNTGEIPHLWAHKVQDSARNAQGNLYFDGDTIYSYGSHFPIARHVEKKGRAAVLLTSGGYSVTTSGHISSVRCSIPSGLPVFHVKEVLQDTYDAANVTDYAARITEHINKAARARIRDTWDLQQANRLIDNAQEYAAFFGRKLLKDFPKHVSAEDLPAIRAQLRGESVVKAAETKHEKKRQRVTKFSEVILWREGLLDSLGWGTREDSKFFPPEFREEWTAEHDANYAIAQANIREQKMREAKPKIAAWRRGGKDNGVPRELTLLRIKGNEVQTSHGARVPAEHAARALTLIKAVVARGEQWEANGHTCKVGHYEIQTIDADGMVHAGCHHIPFSEIERIAPRLEALKVEEVICES